MTFKSNSLLRGILNCLIGAENLEYGNTGIVPAL